MVLGFVGICTLALILSYLTGERSNVYVFSVYRSSFASPLAFVRLIGHVFGHSGLSHYINNMMYILILGPLLEEKYGHRDLIIVILATALITGLVHIIFSPSTRLLGASGVVFAFILLASMTSFKEGSIPITFILVALIYIGQQIYQAFFVESNVSNVTHIVGGIVGASAGFILKHAEGKKTA